MRTNKVRSTSFTVVALALALGTRMLATEVPLSTTAWDPSHFHRAGNRAVFLAWEEQCYQSLWSSDGTPGGTLKILDPCVMAGSSGREIEILGSTGPLVYFLAPDSNLTGWDRNIYRTDGTLDGTFALLSASDAHRIIGGAPYNSFAIVGPLLLFKMQNGFGQEVWATTGSPATTSPLLESPDTAVYSSVTLCGRSDTTIYLLRYDFALGHLLYRFDALPPSLSSGTDFDPACGDALALENGLVIPGPGTAQYKKALWYWSGTSAPILLVDNLDMVQPIEADGTSALAILREGEELIPSLWITDGSPAGTHRLKQGTRWESFYYQSNQQFYERVGDHVFYFYINELDALELRRVGIDGAGDSLVSLLCGSGCRPNPNWNWMERLGNELIASILLPGNEELIRIPEGSTTPIPIDLPCASFCDAPESALHLDGALVFPIAGSTEGLEVGSLELPAATFALKTSFDLANSSALLDPYDAVAVSGKLFFSARESGYESRLLFAVPLHPSCEGLERNALCLDEGRFRVTVHWSDFLGGSGSGVADTLTNDTGYLWFFDDANIELMLKIVDGTSYNGFFWVYYGALSNVEYWITVEDTLTGHAKTYHNALGEFGSFGDIEALPSGRTHSQHESSKSASVSPSIGHASALLPMPSTGTCAPSSTRACLLDDRFAIEAEWTDFGANHGVAYAENLTSDTGYLWFFDPDAAEIVVKLIDGSGFNSRFWVYYGSLSNVEFTLHVTDTTTDETRSYHNPLGAFGSFGDIDAFPAP